MEFEEALDAELLNNQDSMHIFMPIEEKEDSFGTDKDSGSSNKFMQSAPLVYETSKDAEPLIYD